MPAKCCNEGGAVATGGVSVVGGDALEADRAGRGARLRKGATSRIASAQIDLSADAGALLSARAIILRALSVPDDDDVQSAGAVRTEHNALFDVTGSRRAGDKIDRPRQDRPGLGSGDTGPEQIPTVLISRNNLRSVNQYNMRFGQKVECRWRRRAGGQHQGPGFSDRRDTSG
jgi:hypothetical protein